MGCDVTYNELPVLCGHPPTWLWAATLGGDFQRHWTVFHSWPWIQMQHPKKNKKKNKLEWNKTLLWSLNRCKTRPFSKGTIQKNTLVSCDQRCNQVLLVFTPRAPDIEQVANIPGCRVSKWMLSRDGLSCRFTFLNHVIAKACNLHSGYFSFFSCTPY